MVKCGTTTLLHREPLWALVLIIVACTEPAPQTPPPAKPLPPLPQWTEESRAQAIETGAAVIHKHQCTRCHVIDELPGIGRPFDCVKCHSFLKGLDPEGETYAKIAEKQGVEILERYRNKIKHLIEVPNLSNLGKRLRAEWVEGFLAEPHDLRPVLEASMIRNKLEEQERRAIARYFAAVADSPDPYAPGFRPTPPPPKPDADRLARGQQAYIARGCPSCHVYGNQRHGGPDVNAEFLVLMAMKSRLAPNHRFARDRLRPDMATTWIKDPTAILPGTTMPKFEGPPEEIELIRDFLFYGDIGSLPAAPSQDEAMRLPPAVDHDVGWAEVKERVIGHVCVHCHMNDFERDTGPGNKGGLGFPGKQLSFRTYERTVWGAVDDKGVRYSVLETLPDESMPRILQVVLRRRAENLRDRIAPFDDRQLPHYPDGLLGMPMGLPALTDEQIGILRKWLEQGCPGPDKVTGKRGMTDGLLVPDGPIAKNRGCELRAPAATPPKWSSAARAK